ncbi:MAG TPA: HlyD family efflux transporter periplasmic adaptor subunit [Hyphomicrobiaceae bacterium]|nr:HlyD family efflux transporter periplasmic adaptor subunit [Hyphomicrobiaceae bacterium]
MGFPGNISTLKRSAFPFAVAVLIAGGLIYALMPRPVPVDLHTIVSGALKVSVDEEGRTRIKDVFVVSAPASGRVLRSPLEPGDLVEKGRTTVAEIEPSPPPFLDLRSQRELRAQISAARANVDLAAAEVQQAQSELDFAKQDLARAQMLVRKEVVSQRTLEKAGNDVQIRRAALARAKAGQELRERELETAMAKLTGPGDTNVQSHAKDCCVSVTAPVSGRVLKILQKSAQIVAQGTPLLEIGDPSNLEIVVELLSADAVRIKSGARAEITAWGGLGLTGEVSRIEPAGFTKVSALGIEEQRVRVVLDLKPVPGDGETQRLGHDYRVVVRIIVHELTGALLVPLGALFRHENNWAVYAVRDRVAVRRKIQLGFRNSEHAAVEAGIGAGEDVILHPNDLISEGVRVTRRSIK